MSTVKQIRVGKNGSLIDIESVNDNQHANFATSTTLDELTQRVTTLETTVGAIEVPDLTELNTKVAALEALNIQSTIEALVARIEALENGGHGGEEPGGETPVAPFVPVTYSFISYGDENGNIQYATGTVQTVDNKETIDSVEYTEVNVVTNSVAEFEGKHFLIASNAEIGDTLYQLYNTEKVAQQIWVKLVNPQSEPEPVVFATSFHAGTANYGNSTDGINQRLNQDKLSISTANENDATVVTLTGDVSLLTSWISTNPNQQDKAYKWYALDFVFDPEHLEGLTWNGNYQVSEIMDEPEGPNTVTLWLKIEDLISSEKTVTLSNGTNTQIVKVCLVNTFESVTYNFTSYADKDGNNIWATGTVQTTGNTTTIDGVNYSEAEVKTNSIDGWVGQKFYIVSNAKTDGTIYRLRSIVNNTELDIWVTILE